jgi:hypothetical protein
LLLVLSVFLTACTPRNQAPGSRDLVVNSNLNNLGGFEVVNAAIAQPDGKILVAGVFREVNGEARSGITRLNPDGRSDFTD